jgi:5-formyltetrahydrofolate cyclo-ligase
MTTDSAEPGQNNTHPKEPAEFSARKPDASEESAEVFPASEKDLSGSGLAAKKAAMRNAGSQARRDQPDKEAVSRQIISRVMAHPQYADAGCVLWYIDVRDEVQTRHALPDALAAGGIAASDIANDKRIVVPFCDGQDLRLFELKSMGELRAGAFGILEPKPELRSLERRNVSIRDVDLVFVPGVAFDRSGGRIGHGNGFYDRCLQHASSKTCLMGIAFACQVFDQVPTEQHDIRMDFVATEHDVTETTTLGH